MARSKMSEWSDRDFAELQRLLSQALEAKTPAARRAAEQKVKEWLAANLLGPERKVKPRAHEGQSAAELMDFPQEYANKAAALLGAKTAITKLAREMDSGVEAIAKSADADAAIERGVELDKAQAMLWVESAEWLAADVGISKSDALQMIGQWCPSWPEANGRSVTQKSALYWQRVREQARR